MTTISLTLAQEIKIDSLENGPGLLPFQLGKTKIISHYHTFIQDINLEEIQSQVIILKTELTDITNNLTNTDFNMFKYQIRHLYYKLDKISTQLDIFRPTSRAKRGLIDPLGSIIKSITGNLDQNDAIKFENAINLLQNDNKKISSSLNNHISLFKEMSQQQTQILSKLKLNQEKMATTLSYVMNITTSDRGKLIHFAHLSQLFIIINENIQELSYKIVKIENLLAFSRKKSVHHSILSINNLKSMINTVTKIYSSNEILDIDIRHYYDVISIGSYFTDKKIVVILKFPITHNQSYELYRLCPAPNKKLSVIIPPYPYLATDSQAFVYMEAECPKIDHWYLCEESTYHQTRTEDDCIHHLLQHQEVLTSCTSKRVTISKVAFLKLDDQHYIIIFPSPTKVQLFCNEKLYKFLQGTYLVTLPHTCKIITKQFTIINENNRIFGKGIQIITYNQSTQSNTNLQVKLNLKTIDLNALNKIENRVMVEPPVEINSTDTSSIYHTTIPLYALLIITTAAILIVFYMKKKNKRYCPDSSQTLEERRAATFSLEVGK